jgi:hypothetical protein
LFWAERWVPVVGVGVGVVVVVAVVVAERLV